MEKEQKEDLIKIIVSGILFLAVFIVDKIINLGSVIEGKWCFVLPLALYLIPFLIVGYEVIVQAFKNLFTGKVFDETLLMTLATLGAFALAIVRGVTGKSIEGFDEACVVMLLYAIGEFFQDFAVDKTKKSISGLVKLKVEYATLKVGDKTKKVKPEELRVGDLIVIAPGEKVAVDGVVVSGESTFDTKAITGESLPKEVRQESKIYSGCINLTSTIVVRVEKEYKDSTVAKILDLVENASQTKSTSEKFISKFARIYTPLVVGLALLIMIIPSIITGNWGEYVYRALSFLVVSCPCALVISVPLSFFVGLGKASKNGILIKGSEYLEKLGSADIFVFDKTGTLTQGNLAVKDVFPKEKEKEILECAFIAEQYSSHPIALSILNYAKNFCFDLAICNGYVLNNLSGLGVEVADKKNKILCGNVKLMLQNGIEVEKHLGTVVYVAKNGIFIGGITLCDKIKTESKDVIVNLKAQNCDVVMLTGDKEDVAKNVSDALDKIEYKSNLLPTQKAEQLDILLEKSKKGVCFVGDGINDAVVLTKADVGISMGGVGSDVAIESSDVVLMKDDLRGILKARKICKTTIRKVKENIVFAIVAKVAILVLSMLGITNMWLAIFGDVGVACLTIINSILTKD